MSELVHRLDVGLSEAMEIAALVRAPDVSITKAAQLIEQYAQTVAAGAALDATGEALARLDRVMAETSHA